MGHHIVFTDHNGCVHCAIDCSESEEQFLARLDAELEADDPWKRVASLVNHQLFGGGDMPSVSLLLTHHGTHCMSVEQIDIGNDDELHVQDVSRFREVLVQLKTNAPLAADN